MSIALVIIMTAISMTASTLLLLKWMKKVEEKQIEEYTIKRALMIVDEDGDWWY